MRRLSAPITTVSTARVGPAWKNSDFAQLISGRSAPAKTAAQRFLAKAVPLVFRGGERAELMQDLVWPLNNLVFGELLGVPVPNMAAKGPSVSQIFDRFLGLNRRTALQSALAQLSQAITSDAGGLSTSADYATALLVVGHDSLAASLGASLVGLLEEAADARLCDLDYPDDLPRTGVPYVERIAQADCTIRGYEFHAEDRVRLFLDACPARGSAYEEAPFFGRGRHLCLGKDLSQWVWRTLTQELARLPLRVRIRETRIRPNDYVFTMYDRIEVTIYE